jgi:hypothetical protein
MLPRVEEAGIPPAVAVARIPAQVLVVVLAWVATSKGRQERNGEDQVCIPRWPDRCAEPIRSSCNSGRLLGLSPGDADLFRYRRPCRRPL